MTNPETKVRLRTDSSFSDMVKEGHHIGKSPLSGLVKMVSMFPTDHMHLCCLGVMRKLFNIWLKGKNLATWVPPQTVEAISVKLLKLHSYMPCEFNHKPRGLSEIDRLKATELRSFMLYWVPVILKDSLPSELYDNYMLFSVGMYLLLSPGISEETLAFTYKLMVSFVEHFGSLCTMYTSLFIWLGNTGHLAPYITSQDSLLRTFLDKLSIFYASLISHYNR